MKHTAKRYGRLLVAVPCVALSVLGVAASGGSSVPAALIAWESGASSQVRQVGLIGWDSAISVGPLLISWDGPTPSISI